MQLHASIIHFNNDFTKMYLLIILSQGMKERHCLMVNIVYSSGHRFFSRMVIHIFYLTIDHLYVTGDTHYLTIPLPGKVYSGLPSFILFIISFLDIPMLDKVILAVSYARQSYHPPLLLGFSLLPFSEGFH